MDFNFKRGLSILSACTLGWLSGFFIYITILFHYLPISVVDSQKPVQMPLPIPHSEGTYHHAVIRVIAPVQENSPIHWPYTREPSRRYYL